MEAPALTGKRRGFRLGPLASEMGREGYEERVRRVVEYIRAGHVYQANLAHRMSGAFSGSAREMAAALFEGSGAWYGAYVEVPEDPAAWKAADVAAKPAMTRVGARRIVVSASPELFLEFDPATRRVVTRPMKGTRSAGEGLDRELRESGKDRAELNMIIDVLRNDLGRVCEMGSVRVEEGRVIERHGGEAAEQQSSNAANKGATGEGSGRGLWQATATVSGRLRGGAGIADLLEATFPGGSVTGAPKIRAMQIIEELEPVERGPYCGAVGYVSDCGRAAFSVAIRTAMISGVAGAARDEIKDGVLHWPVGAGIVAESDPHEEWEETIAKAGVIRAISETGK
jgi:para-aminobenzoate synthetase component 1